MRGERIRRGPLTRARHLLDLLALQIRERLADDDGHHDHGDQHQGVSDGGDQEGEDVVEEEDGGDDAVDGCDAGLCCAVSSPTVSVGPVGAVDDRKGRTMVIVPMKMAGGVASLSTISAMKLAVRPMMAMRQHAWMMRATWKVAPRAPYLGMLVDVQK